MKLTKQTVYLQVNKDSNLTVGAFSPELDEWNSEVYVNKQESFVFTPEQLNEYTANVIKQALDTAAKTRRNGFYDSTKDEQSITNTFEETFKKFEV